jgi:hypothetical protein
VEQLNAHPEYCGHVHLTEACLNAMPGGIKGLNHGCLGKFTDSLLSDLNSKLMAQITDGSKEAIPKTLHFIRAILARNNWVTNPALELRDFIVKDAIFMDKLLKEKSFPQPLLSHLIVEQTVPNLTSLQCEELSKDLATLLEPTALKKVSPACMEHLKPEFFAGIDSEVFKNINPDSLTSLTQQQAAKLHSTAVRHMTVEQASNWGLEPKPPIITASSQPELGKQQEVRKAFFSKHACTAAKNWKEITTREVSNALTKRCYEIWNAAPLLLAPKMWVSVLTLAVGALVFMV